MQKSKRTYHFHCGDKINLRKHRLNGYDLPFLLRTLREISNINELTPTIINSLIDIIEIHNNDKSSFHCYVKVDIYFSELEIICILIEEEIPAVIDEIKKNHQQFRYVL
ncbi:MAG: DUF4368 domain-containing protein [Clostridium sp.]|nr:DUF4368 domain-containing protein [Clostridium sp.]